MHRGVHSKLPWNICIFLCTLVCKYSESVHSKIPELGIGSPQRSPCLFLYFGFHTTNAPLQNKLRELKVWHLIVHMVQSKPQGIRLVGHFTYGSHHNELNAEHKPKDTELEIKNKSPVSKLRLFGLHPVFVTVRSWQQDQAQTAHKKGRHSAAEYAALHL